MNFFILNFHCLDNNGYDDKDKMCGEDDDYNNGNEDSDNDNNEDGEENNDDICNVNHALAISIPNTYLDIFKAFPVKAAYVS